MTRNKEKLVILLVSFAVFMGCVFVLGMDRGPWRTGLLALGITTLLSIAVRQSVQHEKEVEKV